MRDATGALQWRPAEFWSATLTEYMLALEGFNAAHGGNKPEAPSDAELDALVARYG